MKLTKMEINLMNNIANYSVTKNIRFFALAKAIVILAVLSFLTLYGIKYQTNAQDIKNISEEVSSSIGGHLDQDFNTSVATLSNLIINKVVVQSDGKTIIGGKFNIGGETPHNGIARIDLQGNIDTSFSGGTGTGGGNQEVYAIAVQSDGKILVGGQFEQFNKQTVRYLVRLNSDGSLDDSFDIGEEGTFGAVRTIAIQPDGKILVGGEFFQINGVPRNRVARLNQDGTVDTTFNVEGGGPSHGVYAIAYQSNGKVLIGGIFGNFNDDSSSAYFLRLNSDGSLDNTFNIGTGVSFRVFSIYVQNNDQIIIGGFFSSFNGVSRNNVARLNSDGSLDLNFNPNVTNDVYSVVSQPDGKVLVGGNFNQVNGATRGSIARLNSDGTLDNTYPAGVSFKVNSLFLQDDGKAVAGGEFSAANGLPRNAVARFEASGDLDSAFDPIIGSAGFVNTISVYPSGDVLVGGFFNSINNVRKNKLARINNNGTPDSTFDTGTGANSDIRTTAIQPDGKILVGGDFNQFSGTSQNSIARLNSNGSIDNSFNLQGGISSRVRIIKVLQNGKIMVGGGFSSVGGNAQSRVARLNTDGSFDSSFIGEADGDVYDIVEQPDGKVIIGGAFSRVNNTPQVGIARFNIDGSLDTTFNIGTGPGGQVFSIALQPDGKILIGGFFTTFNNIERKYVARLNLDGSLDTSFDIGSGAGFTVFSVAHQPDGKVIVGGDFFDFNGVVQKGLIRLLSNGSVDNTFDPIISRNGFNRPTVLATAITQSDEEETQGKLLIGGRFTSIDGVSRIGLARLNLRFNFGKTLFDFDGDGKTDVSIFRPNAGQWWYLRSSDLSNAAFAFGTNTDTLVPADYTGDGKTDIAFWRESTGEWFILRSEDSSFFGFPFGTSGDIPVPGDFDGDGQADAAVFRPSTATWFIQRSSDGGTTITPFGIAEDKPTVADFDGDGKDDIAIYRPSVSQWWQFRSQDGTIAYQFGTSGDKTIQGDYTGDGKADVGIFRPSTGNWLILRSEDSSFFGFPFGTSTDIPNPGDYDGDGTFDAAVFRPSTNTWFYNGSTSGNVQLNFGVTGDIPIPNVYSVE